MAIDFSSLQATPAQTGQLDFSAIGGIPAVGQNEAADETTALGAAGRGAVGMIPMGEQAYSAVSGAMDKKPYTEARQDLAKEIEADKANHGVARVAGQAAGVIAPALLTGGASAPESLAGAAGEGAMVGAGFGAGNAVDTLASGGSGAKAAGDVALGAGLGAAGGAIGNKVGGLLNKSVPSIENYAAKKAASAVGLESKELGNMTQDELLATGKRLMDQGIIKPGASTQEMFDTAKGIHEGYGEKIGEIGNQADELGLKMDPAPLVKNLQLLQEDAQKLMNPDERKAALWYKRGAADLQAMANHNHAENGSFDVTFDQLQRLKKSYGNSAFENGAVKNSAAADVYGELRQGLDSIVMSAKDNPKLPEDLKAAMSGYSELNPVVKGLQDVLGRERAGNMPAKGFGMMGKLVGQLPGQQNPIINGLTSLGLMGAGHPMWALGAATASLQNPRTMANAASKLAGAIPGVAEKLPMAGSQIAASTAQPDVAPKQTPTTLNMDHPAMAPWKPMFEKNAANAQDEGEKNKSHAVTDFILSQRDPSYAEAKQKVADESEGHQNTSTNTGKLGMSEGGMVPGRDTEDHIQNGNPAFGSTLEGLAQQLKNPTHEIAARPVPTEDTLPTRSTQKFNQPFNTDMEDKLRAFFADKEKDDAQSK